jgi:class 3 adenylate cyclase
VAVGCVGVRATVEGAARSGDVLVTSTAARAQDQNCQQYQQHEHQASDGHCQGKGALRDTQAVRVIRRLEKRK